jgi:hypothetical protein
MIVAHSLTWYHSVRFSSRTLQLRPFNRCRRLCQPRFPLFFSLCASRFWARSHLFSSISCRSRPDPTILILVAGAHPGLDPDYRRSRSGRCHPPSPAALPGSVARTVVCQVGCCCPPASPGSCSSPARLTRSSPALPGSRLPRVSRCCPYLPHGRVQTSQVLLSDPER